MDYNEELRRLEEFKGLLDEYKEQLSLPENETNIKELHERIYIKYGEIEDIIERIVGKSDIKVRGTHNTESSFSNYIEAGYLSGRTFHASQGYAQLLKVIGRIRQLASTQQILKDERSVGGVIQILSRFRECCQYVKNIPSNERDVQDIIWIMLRSHFDRLDRESSLPKFGIKGYIPDFGIPELGILIEVKYIGQSTTPASIQEEILADIPGYLSQGQKYNSVIVLIYDAAHKLRDTVRFVDDLRSVDGIIDVIIIPGFGAF